MSVQKVIPNFSIETTCPLIVTPEDSIFAYQTASLVSNNKNANGRSSECFPNNYAFLQVYTANQVQRCCSNNAVQKSSSGNVMSMLNYGY
jgi:hypothetical protein